MDPSIWNNRRVLITGHTGFKGSWLLLWLQNLGAQVWTYSLDPPAGNSLFHLLHREKKSQSSWHHQIGDLSDLSALRSLVQSSRPEIVFHMAAQALVRPSYEDPVGTWKTNVIGSLHLLEALRTLDSICAVVMVTTDKVYENREWDYGYREIDRLGGKDPYSSSKAAAELAISSWRTSFCGSGPHQTPFLRIATARAGNVIGGGDWSKDRIIPDSINALILGNPVLIRNPHSTRPWQHVLEPLSGYIRLAEVLLTQDSPPCEAINFGPNLNNNRTVLSLVEAIIALFPGSFVFDSGSQNPYEASLLHLDSTKASSVLNWHPQWDFEETIFRTVNWYKKFLNGVHALDCCLHDLCDYNLLLESSQ